MRINDLSVAAGLGFISSAAVGAFGAYIIKPIFNSMSPIGVALTCGITTAIAVAVLFSDMDISGKFLGLMAAYPIGLVTVNLLRFHVRVLDPMVAVFIGGVFITPFAVTAFFLSAIFA